jgi:hypothetical protein
MNKDALLLANEKSQMKEHGPAVDWGQEALATPPFCGDNAYVAPEGPRKVMFHDEIAPVV